MDVSGSTDLRVASLTSPAARHVLDSHAHTVRFYDDDPSLIEELIGFVGAALGGGDAAIVIATQAHREALAASLMARGWPVRVDRDAGQHPRRNRLRGGGDAGDSAVA